MRTRLVNVSKPVNDAMPSLLASAGSGVPNVMVTAMTRGYFDLRGTSAPEPLYRLGDATAAVSDTVHVIRERIILRYKDFDPTAAFVLAERTTRRRPVAVARTSEVSWPRWPLRSPLTGCFGLSCCPGLRGGVDCRLASLP